MKKELKRRERLRKESFVLKPTFSIKDDDLILDKKSTEISETFYDDEDGYTNSSPEINTNDSTQLSELAIVMPCTSNLRSRTLSDLKRDFQLGDISEFVYNGLDVNILFVNI